MFFQARGPVFLRKRNAAGAIVGAAFQICPDSISVDFKIDSWSHTNKCGSTDVEDARGTNSVGADVTLAFSDVKDKLFALAALGIVNAAGSPGTVTTEALPNPLVAGDVYFLGGKERHRNITGLVLGSLVADTDYTLDAGTGKVTILTDQDESPPINAAYGYTDPASVSLLTAPQEEYALDMEFINKQNGNQKGSLEIYRTRFDPATGINMLSDKAQDLSLKGSALADTSRDSEDTEFGQFGRRVNVA